MAHKQITDAAARTDVEYRDVARKAEQWAELKGTLPGQVAAALTGAGMKPRKADDWAGDIHAACRGVSRAYGEVAAWLATLENNLNAAREETVKQARSRGV